MEARRLTIFSLFIYALLSLPCASVRITDVEDVKVAFLGDIGTGKNAKKVLELLHDEGVDFSIVSGDLHYEEADGDITRNKAFLDNFDDIVGKDHPLFVAPGNHDIDTDDVNFWTDKDDGWAALFEKRLEDQDLEDVCETDGDSYFGFDTVCSYKGLLFYLSSHGTEVSGKDTYRDSLSHLESSMEDGEAIWKFCVFHHVLRLFQTGGKEDEVTTRIYEACRERGAIVITSHEHNYARTNTIVRFHEDVPVYVKGSSIQTGEGDCGDPIIIREYQSMNILTGTGGFDLREADEDLTEKPWWAKTDDADFGATICEFSSKNERDAECSFIDIDGNKRDTYCIRSNNNVEVCDNKDKLEMDLVFGIDIASSTTYKNLRLVTDFIKQLSYNFNLRETHIGVVTFKNTAKVRIDLGEYEDVYDLHDALDKIPDDVETGGFVSIQKGIEAAVYMSGRRDNAPATIILIVDQKGDLDTINDDLDAARQIKDDGWNVFVLRIGENTNKDLEEIGHNIVLGTFEELTPNVPAISGYICEETTLTPVKLPDGEQPIDESIDVSNPAVDEDQGGSSGSRSSSSCSRKGCKRSTVKEQDHRLDIGVRGEKSLGGHKFMDCLQDAYQVDVLQDSSRQDCVGTECIIIMRFKPRSPITEDQNFTIVFEEFDEIGELHSSRETKLCEVRHCPLDHDFDITYIFRMDDSKPTGLYALNIRGTEDGLVCSNPSNIEYTRPDEAVHCGAPTTGVCDTFQDQWLVGPKVGTTLVYSAEECCCWCDSVHECVGWTYDHKTAQVGRAELAKAACILAGDFTEIGTNIGWTRGRKSAECINTEDGNVVGERVKEYIADNMLRCCKACREHDECVAWSFRQSTSDKDEGLCVFSSTVESIDVGDNWVSKMSGATEDTQRALISGDPHVSVTHAVAAIAGFSLVVMGFGIWKRKHGNYKHLE